MCQLFVIILNVVLSCFPDDSLLLRDIKMAAACLVLACDLQNKFVTWGGLNFNFLLMFLNFT